MAVCDNYKASLTRGGRSAPSAAKTLDYRTILSDKDIAAVVIATPTHQHKAIAIEALEAGKHVYCEAPLAHTIEDAKVIAMAAKKARHLVFQPGLQLRSDSLRNHLVPFIRQGSLGKIVMARAQWNKNQSWRATSPNAEREQELNWRLNRDLSVGMIGELGIHQLDQALWFLQQKPVSVSGSSEVSFWKDGRAVPDTLQAVIRFPENVCLNYSATLANSFDASYEMFYGNYAALMLRDTSAWIFKEVDSPLFGWEVYARKDIFYKEVGIFLNPDASKSAPSTQEEIEEQKIKTAPLYVALQNFVLNAARIKETAELMLQDLGEVYPEELAKIPLWPAASWREGFEATALAIKANEAVLNDQRIQLADCWV